MSAHEAGPEASEPWWVKPARRNQKQLLIPLIVVAVVVPITTRLILHPKPKHPLSGLRLALAAGVLLLLLTVEIFVVWKFRNRAPPSHQRPPPGSTHVPPTQNEHGGSAS